MEPLVATVSKAMSEAGFATHGQPLLVGVSGGVDSMVLLHLLGQVGRWQLAVAHLDHGLRGPEARADAALVSETARQEGIPCFMGAADVRGYAGARGISLEMAGRELRHALFARAAEATDARGIALGHHADDQVELFLLRLLRGAGGEGLGGMRPVSPLPGFPQLHLLRPFLGVDRASVLDYARRRRIRFREDASNADPRIPRNRIRGELLPLLRRHYQPRLTETVQRVMEVVGSEAELVGTWAAQWLSRERRCPFHQLHAALQRRVLQVQLLERGISPDFDLIEKLRTRPCQAVSVANPGREGQPSSRQLARGPDGRLYESAPAPGLTNQDPGVTVSLGTRGQAGYGAVQFSWRLVKPPRNPLRPLAGVEYFDARKVGDGVRLRHWRPGDRFHPIGMPAPVKVQDLFTNLKVPRPERHRRVVAEDAEGRLFWVEGLRMSEIHKVMRRTDACLRWAWHREQNLEQG